MRQVEQFFDAAPQGYGHAMARALPDEVVITFEVHGDGGGEWTLACQGDQIHVERGADKAADCRLRCSVPTFLALIRGELSGERSFRSGLLQVEGDVGLILRLQGVLAQTRTA